MNDARESPSVMVGDLTHPSLREKFWRNHTAVDDLKINIKERMGTIFSLGVNVANSTEISETYNEQINAVTNECSTQASQRISGIEIRIESGTSIEEISIANRYFLDASCVFNTTLENVAAITTEQLNQASADARGGGSGGIITVADYDFSVANTYTENQVTQILQNNINNSCKFNVDQVIEDITIDIGQNATVGRIYYENELDQSFTCAMENLAIIQGQVNNIQNNKSNATTGRTRLIVIIAVVVGAVVLLLVIVSIFSSARSKKEVDNESLVGNSCISIPSECVGKAGDSLDTCLRKNPLPSNQRYCAVNGSKTDVPESR